jgi:hypothetical protein
VNLAVLARVYHDVVGLIDEMVARMDHIIAAAATDGDQPLVEETQRCAQAVTDATTRLLRLLAEDIRGEVDRIETSITGSNYPPTVELAGQQRSLHRPTGNGARWQEMAPVTTGYRPPPPGPPPAMPPSLLGVPGLGDDEDLDTVAAAVHDAAERR